MRIGLLQLNPTVGAFDENRARLDEAYREAVARARNWSWPRNSFFAATRRATCSCAAISLSQRGLDCLNALAASVGEVPLITGDADFNPAAARARAATTQPP